jgi:hypothetical protein
MVGWCNGPAQRSAAKVYGRAYCFMFRRHGGIMRHSQDWRIHARRLYPEMAPALDGIEPKAWPIGA